ncbi:hypothetical protein [Micromonospora arborensis]|uniref:hypothetical protein n=1 Tax=Micromonospora arborensis TaxID=2116518 RepID=UPI0037233A91
MIRAFGLLLVFLLELAVLVVVWVVVTILLRRAGRPALVASLAVVRGVGRGHAGLARSADRSYPSAGD